MSATVIERTTHEHAGTMASALNLALKHAAEHDPSVLVFGEDVGRLGGVFRITDGLQEQFGSERVFDTPLAESGIVGMAVGLALYGYRPVAEIQFDSFSYPALDQLINHVAKYRNRTRGKVSLPITLRIPYGGGIGAVELHSDSPETYFAHTAGLKVVTPATAADAYSLLRESIECDDPVIFFEPKSRYRHHDHVELPIATEPIGRAVVRRKGHDVTVVAYGPCVATALDAAELGAEEGRDLEVIDLRSLSPFDDETVAASVRRTGRCVVVHEAPRTLGFGAEVAAQIQEMCFGSLRAPVLRVTGFDTPYPPARLERYWLPDAERVLDAVDHAMTLTKLRAV
jgi:2-oxoisovalerate dehydrogenase E1 component beta subunit